MNKIPYTQEEIDAIVELREKGWSGTDIATVLGCDKNRIYNFCKWAGTKKGNSEKNQQILKLHNDGWQVSAIAKKFGISRQRVYVVLKKMEG